MAIKKFNSLWQSNNDNIAVTLKSNPYASVSSKPNIFWVKEIMILFLTFFGVGNLLNGGKRSWRVEFLTEA